MHAKDDISKTILKFGEAMIAVALAGGAALLLLLILMALI